MRRSKKVVESTIVTALTIVLSITAVTDSRNMKADRAEEETAFNVGLENNGIAGVSEVLVDFELSAAEELEDHVTIEKEIVDVVAASAEEIVSEDTNAEVEEQEPELTPEEQEWQNALMADVDQTLNVRAEGSTEAAIVGRLHKGDKAVVVEAGEEFTSFVSLPVLCFPVPGSCLLHLL